jgi:hypothetical protein
VSEILGFPGLVFAFGVDRLRRLPGARFVAPFTKWIPRLLFVAAVVLTLLWAAEASPQRISLADLAAGKLGQFQSWIIVSGELADETGSAGSEHAYRLTDPAAPNAHLDVRSPTVQSLGWTTLSGRFEGGRDGVPEGYIWSARLNADPVLAGELPPPWIAIGLAGLAIVIILARRSRYPIFVSEPPMDVPPALRALRVTVRRDAAGLAATPAAATLAFHDSEPGAARLSITGTRPMPVRLHSAFTRVDVGRIRTLTSSQPALRVRSEADDLVLVFASPRERDATFAALQAETQLRRQPQASRATG